MACLKIGQHSQSIQNTSNWIYYTLGKQYPIIPPLEKENIIDSKFPFFWVSTWGYLIFIALKAEQQSLPVSSHAGLVSVSPSHHFIHLLTVSNSFPPNLTSSAFWVSLPKDCCCSWRRRFGNRFESLVNFSHSTGSREVKWRTKKMGFFEGLF